MLKSLTFSVSLALALGACSLSLAGGHHDGCATCGLASPQGSPQSVVASAQCDGGCDTCAPAKKCWTMPKFSLPKCSLPKISLPKCSYSYEWVLKKKKVWSWGHHAPACDTCGEAVVPSAQAAPSPQAMPAPQAAPKAAAQHAFAAPGEMRPAMAADEVPPAPTVATQSSLLQLTPAGN